jgi:DNA-binding CsgD family transcriptional regulator
MAAGHKSMHLVPFMSRDTTAVGALCVAFSQRHTPTEDEFRSLELYATLAASTIERHQKIVELAQKELTLSDITGVQRSHLKRIEAQLRHVGQESLLLEPEDVSRLTNSMADAIEHWTAEADDEQARFLRESEAGPLRFPYDMSARELEVLLYVWRGMGDKQIAQALGVTRFTVHKHVRSILQKMKVDTRTQASVRAEQEGLFRLGGTAAAQFREAL